MRLGRACCVDFHTVLHLVFCVREVDVARPEGGADETRVS